MTPLTGPEFAKTHDQLTEVYLVLVLIRTVKLLLATSTLVHVSSSTVFPGPG